MRILKAEMEEVGTNETEKKKKRRKIMSTRFNPICLTVIVLGDLFLELTVLLEL